MGENMTNVATTRLRDIVEGKQEYPVKTKKFWLPELDVIAPFVQKELEQHFKNVLVEVVDCPDLEEFGCAGSGLGGSAKLVEGGGEPFNHDFSYNNEVHFKLERMAQLAGHGPGSYLQGAGAACAAQLRGHLGELVPCLVVGGKNLTKAARVGVQKEAIIEEDKTLMCGGISNIYVCKGLKEKVLKVKVSSRTGQQASLTQLIRAGLKNVPGIGGDKQLGMGGVFRMESGEHTHFWREKNGLEFDSAAGGHYHGDITPEEASYTGYFSLAGEVVRIWDAVEEKM